jgi:hypothetical protein
MKKKAAKTSEKAEDKAGERKATAKANATDAGILPQSKDLTAPRTGPVDEGSIMSAAAPIDLAERVKITDSADEELAKDDEVTLSGKIISLNEPAGVTIRVGAEKGDFVDVSLPSKLVTKD